MDHRLPLLLQQTSRHYKNISPLRYYNLLSHKLAPLVEFEKWKQKTILLKQSKADEWTKFLELQPLNIKLRLEEVYNSLIYKKAKFEKLNGHTLESKAIMYFSHDLTLVFKSSYITGNYTCWDIRIQDKKKEKDGITPFVHPIKRIQEYEYPDYATNAIMYCDMSKGRLTAYKTQLNKVLQILKLDSIYQANNEFQEEKAKQMVEFLVRCLPWPFMDYDTCYYSSVSFAEQKK